ncbi:MAG: hypothetical protein J2P57_23365, partial [Acidimicrobiaceae bacterium]|nr:hypothetical protein [Acidimicrobiaceae bacterium]
AWIHISSLDSLQKRVPNLHVLAQATDVLPNTADSFYAARPQWLSANPAIAEAIALAWIHAAKVFNNDTSTWVDMAEAYTLNADPKSAVTADHDTFKKLNLWPLSQSVFTPTVVSTNYSFWNSYHQFSGQGQRPLSQVADFGPWNAAWQVYNKKPNAF